jgi:arsenite methyltransferase
MQNFLKSRYDLDDPDLVSVIDDLPLWSAPFGLKLLDTIKLRPGMTVLDIGSGIGFPIIELSQRLDRSSHVYGIDPWEEGLRRINRKTRMWDIRNVNIVRGKAEDLPFNDQSFGLIVSNNGINNVQEERQVFKELTRVSKKQAQLVVTVNLPDTMSSFYQAYEQTLRRHGKLEEIDRLKEHIFSKRKPLSHTEDLIERAGFKIRHVFKDSFDFRFADGSTMLRHFFIKLAFLTSWKSILQEPDVEPIFGDLEVELNRLAREKGELRLGIPWVCIDSQRV